jgi:tetratricopeptide (TPR) repeat protein
MRKILIYLAVLIFTFCTAQENKYLDSCFAALKKEKNKTSLVFLEKLHKFKLSAITKKDSTHILNAYNQLGINHTINQKFDSGFFYFNKVLTLNNHAGDNITSANAKMNLGIVLRCQKNYEKSEKYFNEVLNISKSINDKDLEISVLYNMSGLYLDWNKYRKALSINLKNYKLSVIENDLSHQIKTLEAIGSNYSQLMINDSAKHFLLQAYDKASAVNYEDEMGFLSNNIGALYLQTKNFVVAEQFLKKAETICIKNSNLISLVDVYDNFATLFEKTNSLKNCTNYFKKKDSLKTIIYDRTIADATTEMEAKYQSETKDLLLNKAKSEIIIQEEKNKKQTLVIWLIIVALTATLLFFIYSFLNYKKAKRSNQIIKNQNQILELQKKEVEYQKDVIEEKQNEIIDSITYAKRIQQALLPTESFIERILKNR